MEAPRGRWVRSRRPASSFSETGLAGALAGFTIFLGLPLERLRIMGNCS
jgi:hypothetical protein